MVAPQEHQFVVATRDHIIYDLAMTPAATKVIATHLTYRSRAQERGKLPAFPSYFFKPVSSLAPGGGDLCPPAGCRLLAFEGEIALVIGQRCGPSTAAGWSNVGWVTAANDFGVYDLRYADAGSNVRSKGFDGSTPIGPDYLAAPEIDPDDIVVRTWVNGDLRQDARTGDEMLFSFDLLVADLARTMTLEPGDVILTGTPTGSTVVGPGDVVEVEISTPAHTSGRLRSTIVAAEGQLTPIGAMPRVTPEDTAAAYGTAAVAEIDATAENGMRLTAIERLTARLGETVLTALQSVSTATIASQLRKIGLDGCILDGLSTSTRGTKMIGFARTLLYLPMREDLRDDKTAGHNAQKRAVESIEPGDILVIGARQERHAGTIGDILALRAQQRGAVGIITDGAVRDGSAVDALDIPTFSAGRSPSVLSRRHLPWAVDVAVACGGALVEPGDLLIGDDDGVVLLPAAHVAAVAHAGVEQERAERFILDRVRSGASVDGLYPMNAAWKTEYERSTAGEHS